MSHTDGPLAADRAADLILESRISLESSRRGLCRSTLAAVLACGAFAAEAIRAGIVGAFGLRQELLLSLGAIIMGIIWINWRRASRIRMPNEEL